MESIALFMTAIVLDTGSHKTRNGATSSDRNVYLSLV